jgi:hypothetical protein
LCCINLYIHGDHHNHVPTSFIETHQLEQILQNKIETRIYPMPSPKQLRPSLSPDASPLSPDPSPLSPESRYYLLHPESRSASEASRSASEASRPHRSPITPRTLVGGSYQGSPPQGSPDDVSQATQIKQHVNNLQLKERLTGNVDHMINDNRRANTEIAYDPKKKEYMAYCDVVYANDPYKYILSETKVLGFMYYVAYREQKKRGGGRSLRQR